MVFVCVSIRLPLFRLACIQMPSLFIDSVFVYLRIGCNTWIHFGKTLCVHFVLSFVQWMIDCRTNWVNRAIDTFQQLCNCVINLNFSHTSNVNYASWSVPLVDKIVNGNMTPAPHRYFPIKFLYAECMPCHAMRHVQKGSCVE